MRPESCRDAGWLVASAMIKGCFLLQPILAEADFPEKEIEPERSISDLCPSPALSAVLVQDRQNTFDSRIIQAGAFDGQDPDAITSYLERNLILPMALVRNGKVGFVALLCLRSLRLRRASGVSDLSASS